MLDPIRALVDVMLAKRIERLTKELAEVQATNLLFPITGK